MKDMLGSQLVPSTHLWEKNSTTQPPRSVKRGSNPHLNSQSQSVNSISDDTSTLPINILSHTPGSTRLSQLA